jgi:antibiotic biosynthesis monooxygenase (ABM) superfamily enzyme
MLAFTHYTASEWDWVVLVLLEGACAVFLLLTFFWLPLSDWLMRHRIRKELQYRERYSRSVRPRRGCKYEPVGKSRNQLDPI